MEKWKGHLYNWYHIETLEVLNPAYISTVDSGNFWGHMITLKNGLSEQLDKPVRPDEMLTARIRTLCSKIDSMLANVDFRFLFDEKRMLFHIGYHVSSHTLDDGCYDLMASESSLTSLLAVAMEKYH